MRLKKHLWFIVVVAAFAGLAVGLVTCALAWSHPVPGLTRADVVEIKVGAWRAASHDIVRSCSQKDLRAVPEKLLFIWRFVRAGGGQVLKPSESGFVFCGLLVPGASDDVIVDYGAVKRQGRWEIRRIPTSGGSWRDLSAALAHTRRSRPESR